MYERIRQLRINAGMSQDDLAKAMGYSDRSMITKIESGKVDISQKKIFAFAKILNTSPGYLMGFEDQNDEPAHHNDDEINILIPGSSKLSPDQKERAIKAFRSMYMAMFPELYEGDDDK